MDAIDAVLLAIVALGVWAVLGMGPMGTIGPMGSLETFANEGALCEGVYFKELPGFLSEAECDELIEAAETRSMFPSEVGGDQDSTLDTSIRKSTQTWFAGGDHPVTDKIRARTIDILENVPQCIRKYAFEDIQVARYGVGGKYEPHFDGEDCGPDADVKVCPRDQRLATLMVYLTEPESGGSTRFPSLGVSVAAEKGKALFFWVADPKTRELFEKSLHGGDVVTAGEKWIANQWIRAAPLGTR